MRVLLLGGTGNISADFAALLHELGHEVLVLTRGRQAVPPQYRAIAGDRKDLSSLRAALAGVRPDAVVDFLGYEVADMEIAIELFRGAVKQFIFISSATVYAKPPSRLPITEDLPVGNLWWDYAQKKLDCENRLLLAHVDDCFPVTVVRPSHTYSKWWIPNPVSSGSYTFAARLEQGRPVFVPDDGQNPWTLTATTDFAVGLAGLIGNRAAIGEVFHITSDEALTWNQICAEIAAALGVVQPKIVPIPTDFICKIAPQLTGNLKGDKSHPGVFDNSKIKRFVPGFQARKPFRVGVRESVAWLRDHPDHQNLRPDLDAMIDQVVAVWETTNGP
jgi:nucleoside-diphosphate-sugar epimerase